MYCHSNNNYLFFLENLKGISEIIKIPFEPTLKLNDYNARNSSVYGAMNEGGTGGIINSPDSENGQYYYFINIFEILCVHVY